MDSKELADQFKRAEHARRALIQASLSNLHDVTGLAVALAATQGKSDCPELIELDKIVERLLRTNALLTLESKIQKSFLERCERAQKVDFESEFNALQTEMKGKDTTCHGDINNNPKFREYKTRVVRTVDPDAPLPWDDEVVLTQTENVEEQRLKCPLTFVLLEDPVRCTDCGHRYSKDAVEKYIRMKSSHRGRVAARCPVAGCSATLILEPRSASNLEPDDESIVALARLKKDEAPPKGGSQPKRQSSTPPRQSQRSKRRRSESPDSSSTDD